MMTSHARKANVVVQQHKITNFVARVDTARRIGEDERLNSHQAHDAH